MSVWLTIPSARPAVEIRDRLERWRDMGYKIALWRNGPHANDMVDCYSLLITPEYNGWGASINRLINRVMAIDTGAEWFVGGGDDTDPDPTKRSDVIARECSLYFGNDPDDPGNPEPYESTFGVMQPTGDRWGENEPWARSMFPDAPAYIDRICGSPWIGREFARRMNQGKGPFWPEFYHMFADECLCEVAKKLGVLWQRRDLTHHHEHPRRDGVARTPDFAVSTGIYGTDEWQKSKAIFERLKASGFAECMPIP
jgi:hypothetical protein